METSNTDISCRSRFVKPFFRKYFSTEEVDCQAGIYHFWRKTVHKPTESLGRVYFFAAVFKPQASDVPPAAPNSAFQFNRHFIGRPPCEIKPPFPFRIKADFPLRLGKPAGHDLEVESPLKRRFQQE